MVVHHEGITPSASLEMASTLILPPCYDKIFTTKHIYNIAEKDFLQIHGSVSSVTDVSDVSDDSDDSFTSTSLVFLSGRYQAHPRVYLPVVTPLGREGRRQNIGGNSSVKKFWEKISDLPGRGGCFQCDDQSQKNFGKKIVFF